MLDPVDEYRLESSAAFARLLTDFRRQWAVAMMGPVDLEKLGGAALQEGQRERRGTGSRLRASLGEVEWAVEWVKGLEGREAARERAAAAAQRAAAPADGNGGAARGNGFEQLSHGSNELDASEDALMNLLLGKLAYGLPATSPEKLEEALAEANRRAQQRARERRANTDSE